MPPAWPRNVTALELDLDEDPLPAVGADGAWCRWALAFLKRPRDLVARLGPALRPGGTLVAHEYFDYSSWRLSPRSPEFEEFVRAVMASWRASGGEPDIGLDLPRWLAELGFEIRSLQPILDVVDPSNFVWLWPKAFVETGLRRLVELGRLAATRAEEIESAFRAIEASPGALMITPAVLE
jgi:hypothetical protein